MNISVDTRIFEGVNIDQSILNDFFQFLIQTAIESGLNLSTLNSIRVPYEYTVELEEFQRNNSLTVGHSVNGFGKTEAIIHDNQFEHHVYYRKELFLNSLVRTGEEVGKTCLNGLYHELCHVHDAITLYNHFDEHAFKKSNLLDQSLNNSAISLWGEYFAHRKSMEVFAKEINLDDLKDSLIKYEYKINQIDVQEPVEMYNAISKYIETLIRDLGDAHGKGMDDDKDINACIESTKLHVYSTILSKMLDEMYNSYPYWNEGKAVEDLSLLIEDIWESFGMALQRKEGTFKIIRY